MFTPDPGLRHIGIDKERLEKLADDAMKQQRLFVKLPRAATEADALANCRAAW